MYNQFIFFQQVSTTTVSGSEREFSLKGLKERHHYEFWVVARTAVGTSFY
jgi:hypothetical protein